MQHARIHKLAVITLGLFTAPSAFAYLDPGTGSMLIQGLIAGIAMAGVTARMYWHKLQALFGINTAAEESETSTSSKDDDH